MSTSSRVGRTTAESRQNEKPDRLICESLRPGGGVGSVGIVVLINIVAILSLYAVDLKPHNIITNNNIFRKMNGNDSTEDEDTNNNTNTHQEELKSRSVSGEYYARGSAEVATESALTLAKVEHVSRIKSAWREIRGRMWGEEDMHILFLFRRRFI